MERGGNTTSDARSDPSSCEIVTIQTSTVDRGHLHLLPRELITKASSFVSPVRADGLRFTCRQRYMTAGSRQHRLFTVSSLISLRYSFQEKSQDLRIFGNTTPGGSYIRLLLELACTCDVNFQIFSPACRAAIPQTGPSSRRELASWSGDGLPGSQGTASQRLYA